VYASRHCEDCDLEPAPWHDNADDFALLESLLEHAAELAIDYSDRYTRVLRVAKNTSVNLRCTVAFYSAFSWGGPLEAESVWGFTPLECHIIRYENHSVTMLTDETGTSTEIEHDHLSVLLEYFGIDSPPGYFATRTCEFDWNHYLVRTTG